MSATLPEPIDSAGFTAEQKEYLTGLFAGAAARGKAFADVEPMPKMREDEIAEERIKRELHPLDAYEQLVENAIGNKSPDKEDVFRFKWHGLFFLTPVKDAFMSRLRIPGGVLKSYQLRELANIAQQLTSGYVQVTTRANLQMRLIYPKDAPEFLGRIQAIGLHTRGSGADNIRNLTMNPTAGIDPVELIDVQPFVQQIAQLIINDRSFYDLPRKFNIAYDGGGLIGSVEDTNDIGVKAVKVGDEILFRIALGGATGHKSFARDLGVVVPPAEITKVVAAIVRVFIEKGCRTNRKRARLKHLLETMSFDEYLALVEKKLGTTLKRAPYDLAQMRWASQELAHSHVGDYPQKQKGFSYVGATCPVGHITPKQMLRVAELADLYGNGEIRLTVWQNFIIPNVPEAFVPTLKKALDKAGLPTKQSNLASGVIACTGKFLLQICAGEHERSRAGNHQAVGEEARTRSAGEHPRDRLSKFVRATLHGRHWLSWHEDEDRRRKPGCLSRLRRRRICRESGRGATGFFRRHGARIAGHDRENAPHVSQASDR